MAPGWGKSFTSSDVEGKAIGQIKFFCFLVELNISAAMWLAVTSAYRRTVFGRLLVRAGEHGVYVDITQPLSCSVSCCVCHLVTSFSLSSSVSSEKVSQLETYNLYNLSLKILESWFIYAGHSTTSHNVEIQPNITMVCQCYADCLSWYKLDLVHQQVSMTAFQTSYISCKHTSLFWDIQTLPFQSYCNPAGKDEMALRWR